MKAAMKAKDKDALRAIRAVRSAILLAKTEKGGGAELTEEAEIKMLSKLVKQRKDSVAIYKEQGREDLAAVEQVEIDVISKYLPAQMSPEELRTQVAALISELGVDSPQQMGKVMGPAMKRFAGKADGKAISALVKELLNK